MDRDTLSKLRLDRRLIRRRDWIAAEDLERELDALPDVSDKIAPAQESAPESGPEEGTQPEA